MSIKLIVLIILVSLAVIFLTQNVAAVEVTFLLWSISMSRALLIFFTLVIGFALGWFLHSYLSYRKEKAEPLDIEYPKQLQ
jgi:putative membrane protein